LRTICYVDGYNLYYGCLKNTSDKWLIFDKIVKIQQPNSELLKIKYFTSPIKAKVASRGQVAVTSQNTYHRALMSCHPNFTEIINGYHSLEKASRLAYIKPPNKQKRVDVWELQEKQTDVNIALSAYRDAVKTGDNSVEQLVFVSNDTDLEPALKFIREDFPQKNIGVIIPIRKESGGRPPNERLSKHANWTRGHITDDELSNSHLPLKIPTGKKPIKKPSYW